MSPEYRESALSEARHENEQARVRMQTARTKSAWRKAEEELNFWQGKVAFLSQAR